MPQSKKIKTTDTSLFLEELKKRADVPAGDYEKFLSLWEYRQYKRNEMIMEAGKVPKFSVFVLKGCLRQYIVSANGDEHIVYFAEEKHFIGDLAAMRNNSVSNYNLQATEKSELLVISKENWEKSYVQFPWWAEGQVKGMQRWAAKMQEQIANSLIESSEAKYLRLLKERPSLFQRVPQHYIASYLGISPETLSRIRKKISGE